MACSGIQKRKVTLKRQKAGFSVKNSLESDARPEKSVGFSMLNGEKKVFSMEKVLE